MENQMSTWGISGEDSGLSPHPHHLSACPSPFTRLSKAWETTTWGLPLWVFFLSFSGCATLGPASMIGE